MQPKKIATGTLCYLLITFPLAYVWHLVFFKQTYQDLGYFTREEPIVAFGFGAILLQGILLSLIYPFLCQGLCITRGTIKFVAVMGGYHWTMHVLAAAAKHKIEPLSLWFSLETSYLLIQFIAGGICLSLIYRGSCPVNIEPTENTD